MVSLEKVLETEILSLKDKIDEFSILLDEKYENALANRLFEEVFHEPETEANLYYKGLHPDPHAEALREINEIKSVIEKLTGKLSELKNFQSKHINEIEKLEELWIRDINDPGEKVEEE